MEELTIERTYGGALFSVADEIGKSEEIREELNGIRDLFREIPDFNGFFNNPTIPLPEKKSVFEKIFSGKISQETLNFLCILMDRGRTRHFPGMVKAYNRMCDQREGFAYGEIYSAVPLSEEQKRKFEEETGKLLKENVKLTGKTDPSLIGGVKILINGKIIDASLRKRLSDMGNSMM